MKKISVFLVLLFISAIFVSCINYAQNNGNTGISEKEIILSSTTFRAVKAQIKTVAEDVQIVPSETGNSYVEMYAHSSKKSHSKEVLLNLVYKYHDVRIENRGNNLFIEVKRKKQLKQIPREDQVQFGFYVYCAKDFSTVVSSVSGDISAMQLNGDQQFNTVSGDVQGRNINGKIKSTTISGDMRLENIAGELTVNTTSGDIVAERIEGSTKVVAISGDIDLNSVNGNASVNGVSGDVSLKNVSGNIAAQTVSGDVGIKNNKEKGANISMTTVSGDLNLPKGKVESLKLRKKSVSCIYNGGGRNISLNSVSGDLSVE